MFYFRRECLWNTPDILLADLIRRAGNMRSYASDTALPGGKYEEGDKDAEDTARREAHEEVS